MLKLSKQSSKEEMRILIKFIGFKYSIQYDIYEYKQYGIDLYSDHYDFWNGSKWTLFIKYNDLNLLENYFKTVIRSIKLKQLLR